MSGSSRTELIKGVWGGSSRRHFNPRCWLYFTLASAGTGIHAVSNDKYITYLVKVYQKSYDEKYEHLLCSD